MYTTLAECHCEQNTMGARLQPHPAMAAIFLALILALVLVIIFAK